MMKKLASHFKAKPQMKIINFRTRKCRIFYSFLIICFWRYCCELEIAFFQWGFRLNYAYYSFIWNKAEPEYCIVEIMTNGNGVFNYSEQKIKLNRSNQCFTPWCDLNSYFLSSQVSLVIVCSCSLKSLVLSPKF